MQQGANQSSNQSRWPMIVLIVWTAALFVYSFFCSQLMQAFMSLVMAFTVPPAATALYVSRRVTSRAVFVILTCIPVLFAAIGRFTYLIPTQPVFVVASAAIGILGGMIIHAWPSPDRRRNRRRAFIWLVVVWWCFFGALFADSVSSRVVHVQRPGNLCLSNLRTAGCEWLKYEHDHGHPPGSLQELVDAELLEEGDIRCPSSGEVYTVMDLRSTDGDPRHSYLMICPNHGDDLLAVSRIGGADRYRCKIYRDFKYGPDPWMWWE